MSDPVSWLLIERGWKVVSSDGEHLGQVEEIAAETDVDIFSGIEISVSLLKAAKYIPSEYIGAIVVGEVHLGLTADEARTLDFREPGTPSGRP